MTLPLTPAAPVTPRERAQRLRQAPLCAWFTGLPCAGKTTLAAQLDALLFAGGLHTLHLDGDVVRDGLCRGLGMDRQGRAENIRRISEAAGMLMDAGLVVIVSAIAPYAADRAAARQRLGGARFVEVFVDTPLAVCMERDTRGLYARAMRGELPGMTGIDDPYEPPVAADFRIDASLPTAAQAIRSLANEVLARCGP